MHTGRDFYPLPSYTQQYVGGKGGSTPQPSTGVYLKNQEKILENKDKKLLPNLRQSPTDTRLYKDRHDPNNRYNPYEHYLLGKGLKNDGTNLRRYNHSYISINSSDRVINPSSITGGPVVLSPNPISFTQDSQTLTFNYPNNGLLVGDLIQITNVSGINGILRTYDDAGNPTIDIPIGANFMKVYFKHQVPLNYTGTTIQVDISGIKGDIGTIDTASYLGTVPVNVLNTRHTFLLTITPIPTLPLPPTYFDPSPDYFFVQLPTTMNTTYLLQNYNFSVNVLAINGIPINYINSKYPIEPTNLQGYQVVSEKNTNTFGIRLPIKALSTGFSGGKSVTVTLITSINPSYPNPNSYSIDLGKTFHNIVMVQLISSEFPNSQESINDTNNMLYWNDIDDGDYLYSIKIPNGNYTPDSLATTIQNLIFNVKRVNSDSTTFTYNTNHYIRTTINSNTNNALFESYKQFSLVQPIIEIDPEISLTPTSADYSAEANSIYTLTIKCPKHGMITAGEQILIQGAIADFGIPADTLNTIQTVSKIIDPDTFQIILPKFSFNLLPFRTNTGGGAAVSVLIPSFFRLRFDKPNTLGGVLGFRNPGNINSVYNFAKTISNSDPYQYELNITGTGTPTTITNNSINLSGYNYIIMTIDQLNDGIMDSGVVKNAFAKIQLSDSPGKTLFNSHICTPIKFQDPLNELSSLNINYYLPIQTNPPTLYDFNGLEHSFTIEIVTVNDIPEETGINPNTGKNYNQVVE